MSTSMLVRGVMTAIQWVAPLPTEVTFVATRDAALRCANAQLDRRRR